MSTAHRGPRHSLGDLKRLSQSIGSVRESPCREAHQNAPASPSRLCAGGRLPGVLCRHVSTRRGVGLRLCLVKHRWRDLREDGTKPVTAAPHGNGHGERTPHAMPPPPPPSLSGVCPARSGNGHGGCTPRAAAPPTGLHPPEPRPPSRLCRSFGEPNNNDSLSADEMR
ncbi:hypothetical protein HETIRDRAFT_455633 [Heterobasidion irregulare TC 32-1]|uniref:Uncharacterized protein n=1 Tax=Heterobasidion irregulare (strain TC 32-1) TaxID=747525 RepID=W4JT32_HETIT|nr:uncharacterized protein HETIRDRAFT_455633 [Heterobasidion irregulare TC 32-1]ETW76031.1 hypothetical protein HETIRDRAFT_455633 [Heterobasidion irregulare TC 32-1]